jgi:hypothetical protein
MTALSRVTELEAAIARQRHCKEFSAATNQREAIEELLEEEFSVLSSSRL